MTIKPPNSLMGARCPDQSYQATKFRYNPTHIDACPTILKRIFLTKSKLALATAINNARTSLASAKVMPGSK
jgi:hypothetical protein